MPLLRLIRYVIQTVRRAFKNPLELPTPLTDSRLLAENRLGSAHGLGVYLGLASYHASGLGPARSELDSAYYFAYRAASNARSFALALALHGIRLDLQPLDAVLQQFKNNAGLHIIYGQLVALREKYDADIRILSTPAGMAHSLGIFSATAEGQTSVRRDDGSSADRRQIVASEMEQAIAVAGALAPTAVIDLAPLRSIKLGAETGVAMAELYSRCVSAVNTNQVVLNRAVKN